MEFTNLGRVIIQALKVAMVSTLGLEFFLFNAIQMITIHLSIDRVRLKDEISPAKEMSPVLVNTKVAMKSQKEGTFYVQVNVPVLRIRSGPSTKNPIVRRALKGMIFKVKLAREDKNEIWYEIQQPANLRYPKRIKSKWFIAGKYNGEWLTKKVKERKITVFPGTKPEDKWIKVKISTQTLQAFEKDRVVFETKVSTGLLTKKGYQTPLGTFRIFRKELSVYMQGPLPGDNDWFDLPGVPFVMYFTKRGDTFHGTYWHSSFGRPYSHGCVNLSIPDSEWLYWWTPLGTKVVIEK